MACICTIAIKKPISPCTTAEQRCTRKRAVYRFRAAFFVTFFSAKKSKISSYRIQETGSHKGFPGIEPSANQERPLSGK
jgi:hypothetical protein